MSLTPARMTHAAAAALLRTQNGAQFTLTRTARGLTLEWTHGPEINLPAWRAPRSEQVQTQRDRPVLAPLSWPEALEFMRALRAPPGRARMQRTGNAANFRYSGRTMGVLSSSINEGVSSWIELARPLRLALAERIETLAGGRGEPLSPPAALPVRPLPIC